MESATASVMMMVGAIDDGGVSSTPAQPARPMAVINERRMTRTVPTMAVKERTRNSVARMMIRYIPGTMVVMSFKLIS